MRTPLLFAALLALASPAALLAQAPAVLALQGRLEDPAGVPATGTTTLTVRLFNAVSGGAQLHSESLPVTFGAGGLFVVRLGEDITLDPAQFDQELWAELEPAGASGPLSPRIALAAAPYALRASAAEALDAAAPTALQVATNTGDISVQASAIASNAAAIGANAGDISANASAIASNTSAIGANASAISANDGDISTLQGEVLALEASLDPSGALTNQPLAFDGGDWAPASALLVPGSLDTSGPNTLGATTTLEGDAVLQGGASVVGFASFQSAAQFLAPVDVATGSGVRLEVRGADAFLAAAQLRNTGGGPALSTLDGDVVLNGGDLIVGGLAELTAGVDIGNGDFTLNAGSGAAELTGRLTLVGPTTHLVMGGGEIQSSAGQDLLLEPDTGQLTRIRHNGTDLFTAAFNALDAHVFLDMNSNAIGNVATPTQPGSAATKGYVDGITGDLGDLATSETSDLVAALNELEGRFGKTVLVQASGTASENGAALLSAMAAITDASATNGYLVQLEGGVYDLGVTTLQVKSWVHLRGAGRTLTRLTRSGGSSNAHAVLQMLADSRASELTAEHLGGGSISTGIYAEAPTELEGVGAVAGGGSLASTAIRLQGTAGTSVLRACHAEASGSSSIGVRGIDIQSSLGGRIEETRVEVTSSGGAAYGVQLGSAVAGGPPQRLRGLTIDVEGASSTYGLDLIGVGGVLVEDAHVRARAPGQTVNGVRATSTSTDVVLDGLDVLADGASSSGLRVDQNSVVLVQGGRWDGVGTTSGYGAVSATGGTVLRVLGATLDGSDASAFAFSTTEIRLGGGQLLAPTGGAGVKSCWAVADATFSNTHAVNACP